MLIAVVQALVHEMLVNKVKYNNYNYEFLLDGLWKSARYGIQSKIIDPYDNKVISMEKMIKRMINYITQSLKYFNNYNVINIIEGIISNGNEASYQLKEYNSKNIKQLKSFLIKNVDFDLK